MTPALELDSVSKKYGRIQAINCLGFTISAGEFACLLGPNGAGKSTTMRCITGMQQVDSGSIRISGQDVTSRPDLAKLRSFLVPQDVELFEFLTAEETLSVCRSLNANGNQRSAEEFEAEATRLLHVTELFEARDRLVREYSGGMRRKLAIVVALLMSPDLLVLDESFAGLDPESCYAIELELKAFCSRGGAVLLSTHTLEMVQAVADRVIVMQKGATIESLDRAQMLALIPKEYPTLVEYYLDRVGKSTPAR